MPEPMKAETAMRMQADPLFEPHKPSDHVEFVEESEVMA
jgi:hypothetical protein